MKITGKNLYLIRSDKDSHFTGAIAQNAKEDETLFYTTCDRIRINGISIQSKEQLSYRLIFWKNITRDDTDLDSDAFTGAVDLDLVAYGWRIGGANQWYLDVRGIELDHINNGTSLRLYVSLQCLSAAGKTAGTNGQVIVEIYYEAME